MGYRSEVAYAIVFKNKSDFDEFLESLPDGDLEEMKIDGTYVKGNGIYFHADYVKWYASRLSFGVTGLIEVDRHENMLQMSRDLNRETNVSLVGTFIRVGEDWGDTEQESWGDYFFEEDLPYPWQLVDVTRSVEMGDQWPQREENEEEN